jgi:hypothetical protein
MQVCPFFGLPELGETGSTAGVDIPHLSMTLDRSLTTA